MPVVTHANARYAHSTGQDREGRARAGRADAREDIAIEYLDQATAYVVPTWCSASMG
jgi:hypothetical protein